MKKYILPLVLGLSALSSQAFAWVGGPFDNGFAGAGLDRNSIYQGTLSMLNGNGYTFFSPDAAIAPSSGATPTAYAPRGAVNNRAVIYYRGVTYVGSCFGMVDAEARTVQADINASSEANFTASTNNTSANFFTFAQSSTTVSQTLVSSNKSFTLNGTYTARIYQTAPSLRFRGTGELTFLSPTSPDSVATLAFTAYQGLINAIITFVASSRVTTAFDPTLFTQAQGAINAALAGLTPYLNLGTVDTTYDNARKVFIRVNGTRRYL